MLKLRRFLLGESYCTSPVYFSVKGRNANPASYLFFLLDILQFMYKLQTQEWLLCRNVSSKCGDSCVLNHLAWQQPIKMRVGSAFALLSDPNMSLLHSSVVLQSTLFAGREGLLFLGPDCSPWVEKKMFTEFPLNIRTCICLSCQLEKKNCFTRQITEL